MHLRRYVTAAIILVAIVLTALAVTFTGQLSRRYKTEAKADLDLSFRGGLHNEEIEIGENERGSANVVVSVVAQKEPQKQENAQGDRNPKSTPKSKPPKSPKSPKDKSLHPADPADPKWPVKIWNIDKENSFSTESWLEHPAFVSDHAVVNSWSGDNCANLNNFAHELEMWKMTWVDDFDLQKQWPKSAFKPTSDVASKITDLRSVLKSKEKEKEIEMTLLESIYGGTGTNDKARGMAKIELNAAGMVLNPELFKNLDKDHRPIWIRLFSRTQPLDRCIESLRSVEGIKDTILFITIDGEYRTVFDYIVEHVDFIATRIFWHERAWEEDQLRAPCHEQKACGASHAINSHWVFGVRLLTDIFDYDYVMTLEDDIKVNRDYYIYHMAMYKHALSGDVLSIGAYTAGTIHDCHYITTKLENKGECLITDVNSIVLDRYVTGWGSGITKKMLGIVIPNMWDHIYDCVLTTYVRQHPGIYWATPCSSRMKLMPNAGVNGGAGKAWSYDLPFVAASKADLETVTVISHAGQLRSKSAQADAAAQTEEPLIKRDMGLEEPWV